MVSDPENEDSIGYVEYEFARRHSLQARIENKAGQEAVKDGHPVDEPGIFVPADSHSIDAAIPIDISEIQGNQEQIQEEFPLSGDKEAYPITGVTWVLAKPLTDPARAAGLCGFLSFQAKWMADNAQKYGYISLPRKVTEENRDQIAEICPSP